MRVLTTIAVGILMTAAILPAGSRAQTFSNEEASCVQYGAWAVQEIRRAQKLGCDVIKAKERLDTASHTKWCMGQAYEMMSRRAALIHRTGVAHRCAWQGINVTGR